MNQRTESTETNETMQTTTESDPVERPEIDSSPAKGLTTADIANGGQQASSPGQAAGRGGHLLPDDRLSSLREQWSTIQTMFVDEPKSSVEKADGLVAEVMQSIAKRFAEERGTLESQWSGGRDASTEDLRQALQHYRSFFERLLAA